MCYINYIPWVILNTKMSVGCSRTPGRGSCRWRRNRCDAHPGEVVPGHRRHVPQLPQHHARAGGDGCLLHASGHHQGPAVDGQRGVSR